MKIEIDSFTDREKTGKLYNTLFSTDHDTLIEHLKDFTTIREDDMLDAIQERMHLAMTIFDKKELAKLNKKS